MPQQANPTTQFMNTKIRLLKANAAIWFNKVCRSKHLTPNYINIKVSGNNKQGNLTKTAATRYRINQELKFQYRKKQHLNEQLYHIHLQCFKIWDFTWQDMQERIELEIHKIMNRVYNKLNKKLDFLYSQTQQHKYTFDKKHC
jgi:hypothetical protein